MNKLIKLGVNVDHVATVRQARGVSYPSPVHAAILAQQYGADGITVHLRADKRHIQPQDVTALKAVLDIPLNLEMAATLEMVDFACTLKPDFCCLVPETREELSTEGGLDVLGNMAHLEKVCAVLKKAGIAVSLFIDANEKQIQAAYKVGASIVELHTGEYANATTSAEKEATLQAIKQGATLAHNLGLQVNGGHGLHYQNVSAIAAIPEMVELNIGHAIVGHAIMVGFPKAVEQMKTLMLQARIL